MLIDPQGLLYGDRIGCCSDEAQLHFPRLLSASNTFGRFRMSVEWLQNEVYASFAVKPTKEQLTNWLREYHANFLLFVYRDHTGAAWAQWEIPEKLLGRYRLAADKKTPAPPAEDHAAFRRAYAESLRAKNAASQHDDLAAGFGKVPHVCGNLRNISQTCEDSQNVSHDVGVGVGDGVGDVFGLAPASPAPQPSKLHTDCRLAVLSYWSQYVQPGMEPAWDGSEAKALSDLLKAMPGITLPRFRQMLQNRGKSDVNPCERPRKWIASLPNYEMGPLDAFGKPQTRPKASGGAASPPGAQETATRLQREEREKQDIVESWRNTRERDGPKYDAEAPRWVKDILGSELEERAVA